MFAIIGIFIFAILCVLLLGAIGIHWIAKKNEWKLFKKLTSASAIIIVLGMFGICALGAISILVLLDIEGIHWIPPNQSTLTGLYNLESYSDKWLKEEKGYASLGDTKITIKDDTATLTNIPDCSRDGIGESHGQLLSGEYVFSISKEFCYHYKITMNHSLDSTTELGGLSITITRNGDLRLTIGDPDSSEYLYFTKTQKVH